jgi:hypothetical protein
VRLAKKWRKIGPTLGICPIFEAMDKAPKKTTFKGLELSQIIPI